MVTVVVVPAVAVAAVDTRWSVVAVSVVMVGAPRLRRSIRLTLPFQPVNTLIIGTVSLLIYRTLANTHSSPTDFV